MQSVSLEGHCTEVTRGDILMQDIIWLICEIGLGDLVIWIFFCMYSIKITVRFKEVVGHWKFCKIIEWFQKQVIVSVEIASL